MTHAPRRPSGAVGLPHVPMVAPSSALLAATASGPSKAGARALAGTQAPRVRTFSIGGTEFPYDIEPSRSDKLLANLEADAAEATSVSVVASYEPRRPDEQVARSTEALPIPRPATLPRDHVVLASFGNGQSAHAVEFDVGEGTAITLPTRSLSLTLLDYSAELAALASPRVLLSSSASVATGALQARAVRTMRVLVPLGLYAIPNPGVFTLLRDAATVAQAEAAFAAAMANQVAALDEAAAFQLCVDRIAAILPPPAP